MTDEEAAARFSRAAAPVKFDNNTSKIRVSKSLRMIINFITNLISSQASNNPSYNRTWNSSNNRPYWPANCNSNVSAYPSISFDN